MLRSVSLEGRMCLLGVLFGLASYVYTQKWLVLVMVNNPQDAAVSSRLQPML